jgi:prepilin-type N-terminal cleavage/methylation domain-containing protein
MRNDSHSQSGFSLLELMIAIAVMGVVTSQIFIVMGNQKKVYSSNERAVDTQETARMTLDLVSFDTRVGGYMIPAWAAVSSVDGGVDDPDRYCASSVFADPGQIGDVPPNPMEVQIQRFKGAVVGAFSANSVTVDSLDLNPPIDGTPGTVDFTIGEGVIVASPRETYCARISNVDPATNTITFETSDAMSHLTTTTGPGMDGVVTPGILRAVPANIYQLNKDTRELTRNGMLLASDIEDFQVEFWVDNANPNDLDDGNTEFPVNNLKNPDPPAGGITAENDRIRRVRVTVLAVSPVEDQANAASGNLLFGRPKVANRNAGTTADRFRRRMFSASIMPRNMIGVESE